jgi:glycosyltransferase involved in cell wall biosynthesis
MLNSTKISIIVSTYNRPDALQAVIEGCFNQTDTNYEIIVADDGSGVATRDCVAALLARSPVPMQHVWQPDDGFRLSMARNRGTLAASGEYLLFLDGDCIPQPNFVQQHRRLAAPGYVVTGSRILVSKEATPRVISGQLDPLPPGLLAKLALRLRGDVSKLLQLLFTLPDIGRGKTYFAVRRVKGCNLGMWRADLERVNGFDESFRGWGWEDSDLVLRLFNTGVMRKEGAFATEVLHLWHPEAKRDSISSNERIVMKRVEDKSTQATLGLREHAAEYNATASA